MSPRVIGYYFAPCLVPNRLVPNMLVLNMLVLNRLVLNRLCPRG